MALTYVSKPMTDVTSIVTPVLQGFTNDFCRIVKVRRRKLP